MPLAFALLCSAAPACNDAPGTLPDAGDPLEGISEAELGRFLLGKAVFERLVVPDEGLGPIFNAERCSDCHDTPATGGAGSFVVLKASRWENDRCNTLEDVGGDNIQRRATPLLQEHGITGEEVPALATATARHASPPLFGLGLIDAVPDDAILANADPDDTNGDGISGRAGRTRNGQLGRFGRKAGIATLQEFIDTALRFEVGLTTHLNPREELPNGRPLPEGVDPLPEPEIDANGLSLLTDFVANLAPAPRARIADATRDTVARGKDLFAAIGCALCHSPSLRTGDHPSSARANKTVHLYSDLLLHDMGEAMADVCRHSASPSEWRTAPLWGLRFRNRYLHDNRAGTLEEAVRQHGGEAAAARAAFELLDAAGRAALLRFLVSL